MSTNYGDRSGVVDGEIVGPDVTDHLETLLRRAQEQGIISSERMKSLLRANVNDGLSYELGRILLSGIGGAVGSGYRWIGAAGGAGLGALVYDLLKAYYIRSRYGDPEPPGRDARQKARQLPRGHRRDED